MAGKATPRTRPDGDVTRMVDTQRIFGIASIRGPAGALIGVFLRRDLPDPRGAPADVNFSGGARDLVTLNPRLHQPFYIGPRTPLSKRREEPAPERQPH